MSVFITIARGGKSALVRETTRGSDTSGRARYKYCGSFPILPTAPDSVPDNVRHYLEHEPTKVQIVADWLSANRDATDGARQRAVVEELKSAALNTVLALGTGATLSAEDRTDLQQVIAGLREIADYKVA